MSKIAKTTSVRGNRGTRLIRATLGATALLAVALGTGAAFATDYPTKPVRILVPFGPGGLADVTMRLAGEKFTKLLGQPFVVENHPGAGGVAAANELLKAQPDGHTLIVMSNGTTIAMSLFRKLSYDPQKQFTPISTLAWFDLALFVNPEAGPKDLKDLLAKAKKEPGSVNIGSINPGSTQNLTAEYFRSAAGIDANVIPYRTSPDVLAALLRNDITVAIESATAFSAAIKANQVRTIAVTGLTRNPSLPDVPTAQEAGLADYEVSGWNALYSLAGTPDDVIAKLHDAIVKVADMPDIKEKFANLGTFPRANTPKEMAARFEADRKKWAGVIDKAGIQKR